jgi:hypothetical protein
LEVDDQRDATIELEEQRGLFRGQHCGKILESIKFETTTTLSDSLQFALRYRGLSIRIVQEGYSRRVGSI